MPAASSRSKHTKPGTIRMPSMSGILGRSGGAKTPKTPQQEAISFFSGSGEGQDPVQVWELELEHDGGPSEKKSVSRIVAAGGSR